MTGPDRPLLAGRVGRPHGLDGSFYVVEPNLPLLEVGMTVAVGDRELTIRRRAGQDTRPILGLEGVRDRAGAEALRGQELQVSRERAPQLEPDEWWAEDLEGCQVHDAERVVGVVRRLRVLPSCEVLEVARERAEDLLIPLVADAVRSIDVERRLIEVDLAFLGES